MERPTDGKEVALMSDRGDSMLECFSGPSLLNSSKQVFVKLTSSHRSNVYINVIQLSKTSLIFPLSTIVAGIFQLDRELLSYHDSAINTALDEAITKEIVGEKCHLSRNTCNIISSSYAR